MNNLSLLESVNKKFEHNKLLDEKIFIQISIVQFFNQINNELNRIARMVKYFCDKKISCWTDFFTTNKK